ncbi:MAG: hypothetical protein GEU73_15775 [Chloroflexi bacterium]|nr:hypothetical protein [Chloroflexota bacterium]
MTVEEYLAIPYVLTMESVQRPDGEWVRQASYPELPGCFAEAFSPIEAIERLEEERKSRILAMLERGEPVPVPRPPLFPAPTAPDPDRLDFARWLVEQGRINDS